MTMTTCGAHRPLTQRISMGITVIVNTPIFNALSIVSGLAAAVDLHMKR